MQYMQGEKQTLRLFSICQPKDSGQKSTRMRRRIFKRTGNWQDDITVGVSEDGCLIVMVDNILSIDNKLYFLHKSTLIMLKYKYDLN